jgi:hypothetical protein
MALERRVVRVLAGRRALAGLVGEVRLGERARAGDGIGRRMAGARVRGMRGLLAVLGRLVRIGRELGGALLGRDDLPCDAGTGRRLVERRVRLARAAGGVVRVA